MLKKYLLPLYFVLFAAYLTGCTTNYYTRKNLLKDIPENIHAKTIGLYVSEETKKYKLESQRALKQKAVLHIGKHIEENIRVLLAKYYSNVIILKSEDQKEEALQNKIEISFGLNSYPNTYLGFPETKVGEYTLRVEINYKLNDLLNKTEEEGKVIGENTKTLIGSAVVATISPIGEVIYNNFVKKVINNALKNALEKLEPIIKKAATTQ